MSCKASQKNMLGGLRFPSNLELWLYSNYLYNWITDLQAITSLSVSKIRESAKN